MSTIIETTSTNLETITDCGKRRDGREWQPGDTAFVARRYQQEWKTMHVFESLVDADGPTREYLYNGKGEHIDHAVRIVEVRQVPGYSTVVREWDEENWTTVDRTVQFYDMHCVVERIAEGE